MPQESAASWLRTIPGFRSVTLWKSIVAVAAYLFLAFALIVEASAPSISGIVLILGVLLIVLVAANAWNTRTRLPLVKSPNKLLAATGWSTFLVVWLGVVALAAPPSTTSPAYTPTALAPSATATPPRTVAATASPSATATVTPSPTGTPTVAPTKAAVVVVATPKPTTRPTTPPPPPPPPAFNYCGAPSNPWHYSFCGGNLISSPPSNFCNYFGCIASFWHEDIPNDGYVVQCADRTFSLSGGESGGVCNYHGGPLRPLYSQ